MCCIMPPSCCRSATARQVPQQRQLRSVGDNVFATCAKRLLSAVDAWSANAVAAIVKQRVCLLKAEFNAQASAADYDCIGDHVHAPGLRSITELNGSIRWHGRHFVPEQRRTHVQRCHIQTALMNISRTRLHETHWSWAAAAAAAVVTPGPAKDTQQITGSARAPVLGRRLDIREFECVRYERLLLSDTPRCGCDERQECVVDVLPRLRGHLSRRRDG